MVVLGNRIIEVDDEEFIKRVIEVDTRGRIVRIVEVELSDKVKERAKIPNKVSNGDPDAWDYKLLYDKPIKRIIEVDPSTHAIERVLILKPGTKEVLRILTPDDDSSSVESAQESSAPRLPIKKKAREEKSSKYRVEDNAPTRSGKEEEQKKQKNKSQRQAEEERLPKDHFTAHQPSSGQRHDASRPPKTQEQRENQMHTSPRSQQHFESKPIRKERRREKDGTTQSSPKTVKTSKQSSPRAVQVSNARPKQAAKRSVNSSIASSGKSLEKGFHHGEMSVSEANQNNAHDGRFTVQTSLSSFLDDQTNFNSIDTLAEHSSPRTKSTIKPQQNISKERAALDSSSFDNLADKHALKPGVRTPSRKGSATLSPVHSHKGKTVLKPSSADNLLADKHAPKPGVRSQNKKGSASPSPKHLGINEQPTRSRISQSGGVSSPTTPTLFETGPNAAHGALRQTFSKRDTPSFPVADTSSDSPGTPLAAHRSRQRPAAIARHEDKPGPDPNKFSKVPPAIETDLVTEQFLARLSPRSQKQSWYDNTSEQVSTQFSPRIQKMHSGALTLFLDDAGNDTVPSWNTPGTASPYSGFRLTPRNSEFKPGKKPKAPLAQEDSPSSKGSPASSNGPASDATPTEMLSHRLRIMTIESYSTSDQKDGKTAAASEKRNNLQDLQVLADRTNSNDTPGKPREPAKTRDTSPLKEKPVRASSKRKLQYLESEALKKSSSKNFGNMDPAETLAPIPEHGTNETSKKSSSP